MKNRLRLAALLSLLFLLSGCLSSGIDIIVNKDGSGEIVQTFYVQKEYMGFMNLGEAAGDPNMINKVELTNRAGSMGEGVSFQKVEPADSSSLFSGYKAYYTFTDISKVRTSSSPMTAPAETVDESELVRFKFKKGGSSTLTIISNSAEEEYESDDEYEFEDEENESEAMEEGMKEQMKQIYKTMHFWFRVKVKGNISNTNALYSDQSEVTMMDMKFENIVENDELFSQMTSDQNSDLDSVRDQLEKAGVKIDDQEEIIISFR